MTAGGKGFAESAAEKHTRFAARALRGPKIVLLSQMMSHDTCVCLAVCRGQLSEFARVLGSALHSEPHHAEAICGMLRDAVAASFDAPPPLPEAQGQAEHEAQKQAGALSCLVSVLPLVLFNLTAADVPL